MKKQKSPIEMLQDVVADYGYEHRHRMGLERLRIKLERLETALVPKIDQHLKGKRGEYTYIPLCYDSFGQQLMVVDGLLNDDNWDTDVKFIDVGSGISTKLLLADSIMPRPLDLYGIEITKAYVDVAKQLVPNATIFHKDALKFNYNRFDIIYFYRPLMNGDKQRELERRIIKTMKPGAIVMANLKALDSDWRNPPMQHIWGDIIYRKRR